MTPEQFAAIGAALYGPSWQRALAKALGQDERTMRRYAKDENPVPVATRRKLVALLVQHGSKLADLRRGISLT